MDFPHMKADSSSESHHISAQNEEKHILALYFGASIFQNFLGEHAPDPSSGVTHAATPTTSMLLKISLFAKKSTCQSSGNAKINSKTDCRIFAYKWAPF